MRKPHELHPQFFFSQNLLMQSLRQSKADNIPQLYVPSNGAPFTGFRGQWNTQSVQWTGAPGLCILDLFLNRFPGLCSTMLPGLTGNCSTKRSILFPHNYIWCKGKSIRLWLPGTLQHSNLFRRQGLSRTTQHPFEGQPRSRSSSAEAARAEGGVTTGCRNRLRTFAPMLPVPEHFCWATVLRARCRLSH